MNSKHIKQKLQLQNHENCATVKFQRKNNLDNVLVGMIYSPNRLEMKNQNVNLIHKYNHLL